GLRSQSVVPMLPAETAHVLTYVEWEVKRLSQASIAVWNMSAPSLTGQPSPFTTACMPPPTPLPPTRRKPNVGRLGSRSWTSKSQTGKLDIIPPSTIVAVL